MTGEKYLASYGNQNTLLGISMNILKLRPEHKAAVFELGIRKRGAMKELAQLLRPTIGIVTHIGHAHMEGLGSLHDIAMEKRAIFSMFEPENIGIINGDLDILTKVSYPHPIVKIGMKTTNQFEARKIVIKNNTISFIAKVYDKKYPVILQGSHEARIMHALGALAVAYYLNIPMELALEGVQKQTVVYGRFEERAVINNGIIINDAYNANPESMKAAMLAFHAYTTDREKIMVIGDMLDLGIDFAFWNRQIGRFLRKVPSIRHVILVGSFVEWTLKTLPAGMKVQHVPSVKELIPVLKPLVNKNTIVLLKASNGIGLHQVPDHFALP
jgi:UDP-N-acetylmuramyl pentapeptide synthase